MSDCTGCRCPNAGGENCRLSSVRIGQGCPIPDRGGSNRPTTGHSWALQPRWCVLMENGFKKGWKILYSSCGRRYPADSHMREGQGGGAPGVRAEIPLEKTMVKQAVLLQPMKGHIGADIYTAAHGGSHTRPVSFFFLFSSLCCWEWGVWEHLGGCLADGQITKLTQEFPESLNTAIGLQSYFNLLKALPVTHCQIIGLFHTVIPLEYGNNSC